MQRSFRTEELSDGTEIVICVFPFWKKKHFLGRWNYKSEVLCSDWHTKTDMRHVFRWICTIIRHEFTVLETKTDMADVFRRTCTQILHVVRHLAWKTRHGADRTSILQFKWVTKCFLKVFVKHIFVFQLVSRRSSLMAHLLKLFICKQRSSLIWSGASPFQTDVDLHMPCLTSTYRFVSWVQPVLHRENRARHVQYQRQEWAVIHLL